MNTQNVLRWIVSRKTIDDNIRKTNAKLRSQVVDELLVLSDCNPQVRLTVLDNGAKLEPVGSGFLIQVIINDAKTILCLGGWHDDLYWPDALGLIHKLLDGELRVRYDWVAPKSWQWAIELLSDGGTWYEASCQCYGKPLPLGSRAESRYFLYSKDSQKPRNSPMATASTQRDTLIS
jgi:hypothetical protein